MPTANSSLGVFELSWSNAEEAASWDIAHGDPFDGVNNIRSCPEEGDGSHHSHSI